LGLVALLTMGCSGDGNSGPGTTGPATASLGATASPAGEASSTPRASTGAIVPADPSPSVASTTPEPVYYDAFLAKRNLVLGEPPVEADVTGDGEPEAFLNAHIPDCASCHARTFFVLSGEDVLFEAGGEGWLVPHSDSDGFEWFSPLRIPGEPLCCPSWFFVGTYGWDGSEFVLGETVDLQHFLEVNDMPLTAPLEPPVQLATVVLYYTSIDRDRYVQAYDLMSEDLQGENPFDAWQAGFDTTESVLVESVSAGASASEISVRFEATDTGAGTTTTTKFEGVWTLIEEGGEWQLDAASIQAVSP
jgi:hypothetical protein